MDPALLFPVATGATGAAGTVIVVTADAEPFGPSPTKLCARTVTVYEVAGDKPVMVQVSVGKFTVHVLPAAAVAVYEIIGSPPSFVGSSQLTISAGAPAE